MSDADEALVPLHTPISTAEAADDKLPNWKSPLERLLEHLGVNEMRRSQLKRIKFTRFMYPVHCEALVKQMVPDASHYYTDIDSPFYMSKILQGGPQRKNGKSLIPTSRCQTVNAHGCEHSVDPTNDETLHVDEHLARVNHYRDALMIRSEDVNKEEHVMKSECLQMINIAVNKTGALDNLIIPYVDELKSRVKLKQELIFNRFMPS
ncbi:uncharacterized protein LOC134840443 [Symsagittifera roscoffensis]|uniref:uncharacterized protein LOC134840443 n=1 Tax=Symsagittifera roscoffensis TaxID=84072 RepID=UPI00307C81D8